jgi:hypothetical protein
MKKHIHEWVYLGDLALIVSRNEKNVALRRSEYCVGCSTLRVQFDSGWYDMRGSATDIYLSSFDGEEPGTVHKIIPVDFRPTPNTKPTRLGMTLNELYERALPIKSPFKK